MRMYTTFVYKDLSLKCLEKKWVISAIASGQDDVLDRLGQEPQDRVRMDGWSAQTGVGTGGGPGLAYWFDCGLSEWKQNLLV